MIMEIKSNKNQTVKECLIENGFSRKTIRSLKYVYVNNVEVRLWQSVKENDILSIPLKDEKSDVIPTNGNLEIIYEDESILVVNKPHGISSMPNKGHYEDSIANFVKYYFEKNNINSTVHLVNRLDVDTSGLMLIAKTSYIHNLFKSTKITKKYYALVEGIIDEDGIIDKPITKLGSVRIIGGNKNSITKYSVIKSKSNTLLSIDLLTGRTHQIRVHMQSIGHSVVGDKLYGEGCDLALQSYYLEFIHPIKKEIMKFEIELEKNIEERI